MSLVCIYCGNPRRDEWPVCCGEQHFETEQEQAERYAPLAESFESFVARMEAQQEVEQ